MLKKEDFSLSVQCCLKAESCPGRCGNLTDGSSVLSEIYPVGQPVNPAGTGVGNKQPALSSLPARANARGASAEIGPSACGHWPTGRLCVSQNGNARKDAGSH